MVAFVGIRGQRVGALWFNIISRIYAEAWAPLEGESPLRFLIRNIRVTYVRKLPYRKRRVTLAFLLDSNRKLTFRGRSKHHLALLLFTHAFQTYCFDALRKQFSIKAHMRFPMSDTVPLGLLQQTQYLPQQVLKLPKPHTNCYLNYLYRETRDHVMVHSLTIIPVCWRVNRTQASLVKKLRKRVKWILADQFWEINHKPFAHIILTLT